MRSVSSPRQMWRSEPQIPPRVIRTTAASGSTSGTVYSRMSKSALNFVMTARRPFMRASPLAESADRLPAYGLAAGLAIHEIGLSGGDPGSQGQRHAEALEGHLDAGEPREALQLVQAAEVADPEHLALDVAEADSEGEIERPVGVGDVGVRVEAGWHDDGGQRVRMLARLAA